MDDDDLDTQWTGPARDRLQEAAEALANELRSHVEALSQMTGCHQDDERLFSANRALAQALRTYNEATFDWSGTFPIGLVNDDEDEDEEVDALAPADALRVSVEARFDFIVRDEARFVAYVRDRFLTGAVDIEPEHVDDHVGDAVGCLGELFRMDQWKTENYAAHGIEAAGEGYSAGEIDKVLFEMTNEEREETGF